MANNLSLGTLVTRCQQRANKPNDGQLDVPEWKELISELYGQLHSAVSDAGARHFETTATINLANLALPTDHMSTIGVDFVVDTAGRTRELPQLMLQERTIFSGRTGDAMFFALAGNSLALYPTPSTGTYKHLYIPQPTDYSTATDATVVDCINVHGARYIVWGVAAIALHRSESEQQRAMVERDQALEKVTEWAIERAKGMPKRQIITDVRALGMLSDVNGAWNPASWRWNR